MDEIDIRKSPAGGFHGTYMQELEMGYDGSSRNLDLDQATTNGNITKGSPASVANDCLFMSPVPQTKPTLKPREGTEDATRMTGYSCVTVIERLTFCFP
jgi:hypothetical protein